jgi:hypothetical protein
MMHGVSHLFDGFRMWKSATDAHVTESEYLSNWSVIPIEKAHKIVRSRLQLKA